MYLYIFICSYSSAWLERSSYERDVVGSIPTTNTTQLAQIGRAPDF